MPARCAITGYVLGGSGGGPMGSAGFPPAPRWLFCPPPEADVAFEPARHQHLPDEGETRGTNCGGVRTLGDPPWVGTEHPPAPQICHGAPGGLDSSRGSGQTVPVPGMLIANPKHPTKPPPVCPPCVPPAVTLPKPCQRLRLCDLSATGIIGFVINYFRQAQPSSCQKSNFFFSVNAILG